MVAFRFTSLAALLAAALVASSGCKGGNFPAPDTTKPTPIGGVIEPTVGLPKEYRLMDGGTPTDMFAVIDRVLCSHEMTSGGERWLCSVAGKGKMIEGGPASSNGATISYIEANLADDRGNTENMMFVRAPMGEDWIGGGREAIRIGWEPTKLLIVGRHILVNNPMRGQEEFRLRKTN